MEYNAAILRNKGVRVDVAVLSDKDGARLTNGDGEPKTEQRWVRFDANAIADIEDAFGSLSDFETVSRVTPFKAIRQALACAWDTDAKTAGRLMLEGKISDYSTAVGVALALANGVDPTQAGRLLKVGVKASTRMVTERDKALEETISEGEAALVKEEAEDAKKAAAEVEVEEDAEDAEVVEDEDATPALLSAPPTRTTPATEEISPAALIVEDDSPSTTGSPDGPLPVAAGMSSGD